MSVFFFLESQYALKYTDIVPLYMRFHIISLFPDTMRAYLDDSILGRAQEDKKIAITYYNPRQYSKDKHTRVDRRPYGGGPGMVLEAEPYLKAVMKAKGKKT